MRLCERPFQRGYCHCVPLRIPLFVGCLMLKTLLRGKQGKKQKHRGGSHHHSRTRRVTRAKTTFASPPSSIPQRRGSLVAPHMTSQLVFSIFFCSPLPSGTWPVHSLILSFSLFSVCLVFFPLSLCLASWFLARPDERKTCPYHFSLRLFTVVRRSSCSLIA